MNVRRTKNNPFGYNRIVLQPTDDQELKAYALSRLLVGLSFRQTQEATREAYGRAPSLSTLSAWMHESPEQAHAISQARVHQIAMQRTEAAQLAREIFIDLLQTIQREGRELPVTQASVVFGVAQDKFDQMVRLSQDNRRSNEKVEAIRAELRAKHHPSELVKMLKERLDSDDRVPPERPSRQEIRRDLGLDN